MTADAIPVVARFLHVSLAQYAADALPGSLAVEEIPLPRRATPGSAGYDFVCPADVALQSGEAVTIPTGIRCEMTPGWVLMLFPRSGLGFRYQVRLANTVGVIDSDYAHAANEGHIQVRIVAGGGVPVSIRKGERFCQGVLMMHGLAQGDEAAAGARTGGFGSTGV